MAEAKELEDQISSGIPGASWQAATWGDGGLGSTASPWLHGPTASARVSELFLLFLLQKTAGEAWEETQQHGGQKPIRAAHKNMKNDSKLKIWIHICSGCRLSKQPRVLFKQTGIKSSQMSAVMTCQQRLQLIAMHHQFQGAGSRAKHCRANLIRAWKKEMSFKF